MRFPQLFALLILTTAIAFLSSCDDDDVTVALVNFTEEAYDVDPVTLDPVTVNISLMPAAGSSSSITIDFSGGEGSFTTSPPLSGNSLELPVELGDQSVSFTVTFDRASLPGENLQVTMSFGDVGRNLGTGITTSSNINVPFLNLQTIPYSEAFGDTGAECPEDVNAIPPDGWTIETVVGDPSGQGTWRCITGAEGAFVHTGTGLSANAFLSGEMIEAWIVSPTFGPITSSTTVDVGLDIRFDPNGGFPYDVDVLIATDYNGLNFETANWQRFDPMRDQWLANDFAVDDLTIYTFDVSEFEGEAITFGFVYNCPSAGACGLARFDDFSISN